MKKLKIALYKSSIIFVKYYFIFLVLTTLIFNISCNEKDPKPTTEITRSVEIVDTKGDTILLHVNLSHPTMHYKHPKK